MDFKDMILAKLNHGASMEDIAKELGDTMNTIQAENAARAKKNSRQGCIEAIEKSFWDNVKRESLNIRDVTALAVLVLESDYPEWTVEDIRDFRESVESSIKVLAEMQGKGPGEMLEVAMRTMAQDFNNAKTRAKNMKDCGEPKDDWARLKSFLNDI